MVLLKIHMVRGEAGVGGEGEFRIGEEVVMVAGMDTSQEVVMVAEVVTSQEAVMVAEVDTSREVVMVAEVGTSREVVMVAEVGTRQEVVMVAEVGMRQEVDMATIRRTVATQTRAEEAGEAEAGAMVVVDLKEAEEGGVMVGAVAEWVAMEGVVVVVIMAMTRLRWGDYVCSKANMLVLASNREDNSVTIFGVICLQYLVVFSISDQASIFLIL